MGNESIVVEVTYTVKDLRRLYIKATTNSMILTVVYVFVVLFIAYIAASHFVTLELTNSFRLSALIFLIVAPLLTVPINLVSCESLARKKAASMGTFTLEITETGIVASKENRTANMRWAAYERAVEFRDRFELVISGGRALLLPKKCFGSPEKLEPFRELLRRAFNGKVEQR